MAFDAAQILRQTYAGGAEAMQMREMAQAAKPETPAPARGELAGTSFVVDADPTAELMDSMEELSFQFEEKEMKRVGDRQMGQLQGARSALVRAVETWLAMMPDMPNAEFMSKLLRNVRQSANAGNPPDAQDILRELGRGSTDPSHQFAMLDILEQAFGEGEEALRALMREAKAVLAEAKGPEIRAGINLAAEVNARATTPEEMQELRDLYRGEVIGFTKPQDCFRSLMANRGPGALQDAISFLIAGCGADLKSSSPSMDSAALGRILTDLGCVQTLQTVLESLTQLGATENEITFYESVAPTFTAGYLHAAWQMVLEAQRSITTSQEPAASLELLLVNLAFLQQLLPAALAGVRAPSAETQKETPPHPTQAPAGN